MVSGFLLANKRPMMSSFDAIRIVKDIVGKDVRVGHTGTLDRFAQGLLMVCISRTATKFVPQLMDLDKEYVVTVKFGELTDTLDHTGEVVARHDGVVVTRETLATAIDAIGRSYIQKPPRFSALKHNGRPMYTLARHGHWAVEDLEAIALQKAKPVKIYDAEILSVGGDVASLRFVVSKGTYVRSLVSDIAEKMGTYATTYELTRTKIGNFSLDIALDIDAPNFATELPRWLLSEDEVRIIANL